MSEINLEPAQPVQPDIPVISPEFPVPETEVPVQTKRFRLPKLRFPNLKKIFLIFLGILTVITVIVVAMTLVMEQLDNKPGNIVTENSEPTTDATDEGNIDELLYSDDPDLVEINKEIKSLDEEYDGTKIREDNLQVPLLDFEVSFKK